MSLLAAVVGSVTDLNGTDARNVLLARHQGYPISAVALKYDPPSPNSPQGVEAFLVEGWALHPAVTEDATSQFMHPSQWVVTNHPSGQGTPPSSWDVASSLWAAFIEQAPFLDMNTSKINDPARARVSDLWQQHAAQATHQKRVGGKKRMSPADIDKILTAHFNSHPEHWNNGRGGKTAVSAVSAITGLPVSTISEWSDENKPNRPASTPAFPHHQNTPALDQDIATMNSIPNDQANEILGESAEADTNQSPDLQSLAKGLAGIQQRLQDATKQVKAANDAKSRAEAAAQRTNETNKELVEKLKDAQETVKQMAAAGAGATVLAVRAPQEDDNSHIPTVDATHIVDAVDREIDWSLKHGSDLLITGPTGCGKTAPIREACARHKRPMRRVCFDGETTSQDLIGRRDAVEGKTVWTDGLLPQAMEAGHVLLVDEIDRADESARAALFSVLDARELYLPVPNRRIRAAAGFQLIAACNGVGDNSGAYTGTQPIDAAFLGRWLDVVRVEYPDTAREKAMLLAAVPGINVKFVEMVCEMFKVLRKAEVDGNLTGPFSIRQSKRMAQLYFMFKCEGTALQACASRAAIRTLIDRTTEDNRAVIRETFQRLFGFECRVDAGTAQQTAGKP